MNDRAIAVLEKYDIEVLRSWKGRSAILCETKTGIKILKEYKGSEERLLLQQQLLREIKKNGFYHLEDIISSKEGGVLVKDEEMNSYYLKEYSEGKECNIRDYQETGYVVEQMALLHKAMELPEFVKEKEIQPYSLVKEFEKHNRELKKIKKYLKSKRQKSDFEYFLYQNYGRFLEKSEKILEEVRENTKLLGEEKSRSKGCLCHGDFQHHNALLSKDGIFFINFEKYVFDSPMRDLSLFFRKMMEKNNWSKEVGLFVLESYQKQRKISEEEKYQLYYRLCYPEKFWKIANFYFNSSKVWIPAKNTEKLEKVLKQEEEKFVFLESDFREGVLRKS